MHLGSQVLFTLFGFPVTNTIVTTLIVDIIIIAIVIAVRKTFSLYPKGIQNCIEMIYEYFYGTVEEISSKVTIIFPWVLTLFLFIVISNLLGQFPGFETIKLNTANGEVNLFKTATSDLNVTAALAVISVFMCSFYSIKYNGIKNYIGRFINFKMFPILLFVGIIEFIGEFTKVISLSCRLFGNMFAGENVINTISSMFAFGLPLPFMMLEVLVCLIQAIVFAMLTMAFMSIMIEKH